MAVTWKGKRRQRPHSFVGAFHSTIVDMLKQYIFKAAWDIGAEYLCTFLNDFIMETKSYYPKLSSIAHTDIHTDDD